MKKALLIISFFLLVVPGGYCQVQKVYGYIQKLHGGARQVKEVPPAPQENEDALETGGDRFFLFVDVSKTKAIHIKEVWINKKAYQFRIDTISKFPHLLASSDGARITRDTLVKKNNGVVLRIQNLAEPIYVKATASLRNVISKNDLVIVYEAGKKMHVTSLKKLKRLRPIFAP